MVDGSNHEASLVELAMLGDFDAFALLYTRHLDIIFRYIFYRIGDHAEAEDLTEQVFLKAWEALPRYKPVGNRFVNWLYRISHNIVMDHHRRQKVIGLEQIPDGNPVHSQDPEALDRLIQAEETEALARAISQLPDDQQQVIILRFVEGMGHAEIAQILRKSETACRGIQFRALSALSRILNAVEEK